MEIRIGGSIENRTRFARMIIDEVRKNVGPFFPIFLRISADELVEGGNNLDDALEYLEYLNDEVDVFDVSCGLNSSIQYQIDANYFPDGWRSYMSKAVKEKFNKPCVSMGNIRDPKVAEEILSNNHADIIGMGRGLIADPEWVNKVRASKEDEIRKCISCNIGCAANRIMLNRPIRCTVNPSVNEDENYKNFQINKPCNVVVIGGGTAGLEAACTASEVGCTTFLLEKNDVLGGLATEISKIPDKKRLYDFPQYLINRANKLDNLFIFKGTEAKVDFIKNLKPNIIVNATGSTPLLPPIKGLSEHVDKENSKVNSITKMIENIPNYPEDLTDKKVVIIGGGAVGLDVMEFFAKRNAKVTLVEKMPIIGNDLDPVTKSDTGHTMEKHHVNQLTNTSLLEVKSDSFFVELENGEKTDLEFDFGFVCLGMKANNSLINKLIENFGDNATILNIGDSLRARRIIEGVYEGRNILNALAQLDYLNDNNL